MDFLKRHYEKLILLGLALAFIATMFHVLSIINRTKEVKDSDLQIPQFTADYQQKDPQDPAFRSEELATSTAPRWTASARRNVDCSDFSSDLVRTFEMARCPKCERIIPFRPFFQNKACPWCGQELKAPPERPRSRIGIRTAEDSDGDGIKDADEQKFGLNPQDPDDALQDNDGDGFSNLFEVEQGFSPVNAANHPPLWMRLRFKDMNRVPLPLKFSALNTQNTSDKKKWDIQFNITKRNYQGKLVERTQMEMLGGTVSIDKREYKIVDIEFKKRSISAKKDNSKDRDEKEEMIDESRVILEEVVEDKSATPDRLVVKVGETAYSSDRRLILEDIGVLADENGKRPTFVLRPGDSFSIGDRRTGISRLILKEINEDAKTAVLVNRSSRANEDPELDSRKKRMVVTAESAIPQDMWVAHEVKQSGNNGNEANGPGM